MAHFAKINDNNIVEEVIVVDNNILLNENNIEVEELGIQFCKELQGEGTKWVQTSYNSNFRKNYAGIGFTYDELRDAFIPPKPYPSWVLNEDSCLWESPIPYPNNDEDYVWNENNQNWDINE